MVITNRLSTKIQTANSIFKDNIFLFQEFLGFLRKKTSVRAAYRRTDSCGNKKQTEFSLFMIKIWMFIPDILYDYLWVISDQLITGTFIHQFNNNLIIYLLRTLNVFNICAYTTSFQRHRTKCSIVEIKFQEIGIICNFK